MAILSSSTLTTEHIFMAVLHVFICAKHCINAHQKGMGRRFSFIFGLNVIIRPSKMALLVEVLAAQPGDLCLIPETQHC